MKKKQLLRRTYDAPSSLPAALSPLLQRIYAARGVLTTEQFDLDIKNLATYHSIAGISTAVALLVKALNEASPIVVVGDFDVDGATSTALMVLVLRQFGYPSVQYLIPNSEHDGYGLTPSIVRKAGGKGAKLIITVDNGITSFAGTDTANQLGIQVLITDHHLPGIELPNADAIVNPNIEGCKFPSKSLAGVGVAFYLLLALRAQLRQQNWFESQNRDANLIRYSDIVALGTVADLVTLDHNNRILVQRGLQHIRRGLCRPGITELIECAQRNAAQFTAQDIAFSLAPRLNAAGRLSDMSISVELLLCEEPFKAKVLANQLESLNQERKQRTHVMQDEAFSQCAALPEWNEFPPVGVVLYHKNWGAGIVGLLSSRLKEHYYRPAVAFAKTAQGTLKGSARSITGLHIRDILATLDARHPGILISFGGHAMAAGLSIEEANFPLFQTHFITLLEENLSTDLLEEIIWSDGSLSTSDFTLSTASLIAQLGPWGSGFPEPVFDGTFRLLQQKLVGSNHLKLLLEPEQGGPLLNAIAFNVDLNQWPDNSVRQAKLAYRLDINEFRGKQSLQMIIQEIWPQ